MKGWVLTEILTVLAVANALVWFKVAEKWS